MSILSFSDVHCVGERNPVSKSVEDIPAEPTLLQVDCPLQKAGDELSLAIPNNKEILSEVRYDRQVSCNDQSNGNYGEIDTKKELNYTTKRPIGELQNGIHYAEKLNNDHEEIASFPKTDSSQLLGHSLSCLDNEVYKDKVGQFRITESYSSSFSLDNQKGTCLEGKQGVHEIDSLVLSNNCVRDEDGHKCEMNKGKENVDTTSNADSILSTTADSRGENGYRPNIIPELSDLPCTAEFALSNLSAHAVKRKLMLACSDSNGPLQIMKHTVGDNNQEGGSTLQRAEYLGQDHSVALWVKWRGKWQTGIRCSRADCPLPTLRAKPTHERKKYIAVFFPRTRTYSWADMLLVRPIDESPEPLVHGTHRKWRKLVKDLGAPQRYIMQKLAVAMLNISDQLHIEALIENARKATTWKEFAKEASSCRGYSDLGRMLLKLQTMVISCYVSHDWLENSFDSWVQRCQSAQTAESIEILREELVDSVLWTEVDKLWNATVQPDLSPEWKTWKQEAMKWFFSSHPIANCRDGEQTNYDNSMGEGSQVSRKRPKLEVRRAESCASQMEASSSRVPSQLTNVDTNSGHYNCQGILETASSCDPKLMLSSAVGTSAGGGSGKPAMVNVRHESDSTNKYRQCLAFIEAKGRQCGRWASDGDNYCCVHLNTRTVARPSQEEQMLPLESPMCGGVTTHGNKCKHRARYGSQYCKKHRLQRSPDLISTENPLISSANKLKRKHEEEKFLLNISGPNIINGEEIRLAENSKHGNLIPVAVGETSDERNQIVEKSELYNGLPGPTKGSRPDITCCIGYYCHRNSEKCLESAKRHTLYCEKHLPKFLKRARNGKSRLVSKDVFINLLKNCSSREQKLYLHQACELLYGFMKSGLSGQKPVFKGDIMGWILSEASKDLNIGEYLLKVVTSEREKVTRLWGFDVDMDKQAAFSETTAVPTLEKFEDNPEMIVRCKICNEGFSDEQKLGEHWTAFHKKEGRWLFRGYACAVCMNSFTNRKVLETHVRDKHGVQFLEHSILFRCMSCNSHFVNAEQLWQHVLSFHLTEFRMPSVTQQHSHTAVQPFKSKAEFVDKLCSHNDVSADASQRYICRLCGLKFDLLPDLGRHHQVAHMDPISISHFPPKRGNRHLKRARHCHPGFKKSFTTALRFKNQSSFGMRKRFESSNSLLAVRPGLQSETAALGSLLESNCSDVAGTLFSEIQTTKPRPSNLEILSIARSACCRISLNAALVVKYGMLPENIYLKAAKLCSELNIQVEWHKEGFICPKGCKPVTHPHSLSPLDALPDCFVEPLAPSVEPINDEKWEMIECHYVLHSEDCDWKSKRKAIILCEDVSFGKESVPVACVVDEDFKSSLYSSYDEAPYSKQLGHPMPWQSFTYVTERLIEQSLNLETKNSQLGCACPHPKCYPDKCDHVYLFDNDYENAVDINGKPIHGRFPYDERGRIILEKGYLIYECNSMCNCDSTCHNRVLQKGVQVKLEIFKSELKGWAVRACEPLARGTFVCEFIGEVVEASKGEDRCDGIRCSYLYDIDAHIESGSIEGTISYVIDATKYGNVSRFINHSCSPNLVSYLVLVESMDCQLAHVGLYASRDIAAGEELAYDYHNKLLLGNGCPCHCGAPNCRGRLC